MRRHLGIRWKVLAVLGLPVLVLALTAGGLSLRALTDARTGRQVGAFADAQDEVTTTITALERERLLSTTTGATRSQLRSARAVTDRETVALASALRTTEITTGLPAATALLDALHTSSARLTELRRTVDSHGRPDAIRAGYSAIIAQNVDLAGAVGDLLSDRLLAQRFAATSVLHRAVEASARVHLIGLDMVQAGTAAPAQQSALAVALTDHTRALAEFHSGDSIVDPTVQQQATAATDRFTQLAAQLQAAGTGEVTVSATTWTATAAAQAQALGRLADAVAADAADQAESSAESTRQRAALVSGAAVALVGLMVLLALIQSRQITAPLRRLAEATTRTREELPGAVEAISLRGEASAELPSVDVAARDEVGAVAMAFRDVQDTVLEIAREQAALRATLADTFVNVARRNQVLLARQLSFIDRLERSEEDPDTLENLFRLDHLATRMRRNAESLLVLAGIDSGRRARSSMTLSDVIRTAVSEVEHYDRVQLDVALNPLVVAHLSLPAAHLVAELIENATTFSDPTSLVRVTTASAPNGVVVRVIDRGLGMAADDLAAANGRLEDLGATSTVVPVHTAGAQRLGLYVVARLAARLGATVRLENATGGGIVATVQLPAVVFVEGSTPQGAGRVQRIDVTTVEEPTVGSPVAEASEVPPLPEPPAAEPLIPEPVVPEPVVPEPVVPEPLDHEPLDHEPLVLESLVLESLAPERVEEPTPVDAAPPLVAPPPLPVAPPVAEPDTPPGLPRRRPGATVPSGPPIPGIPQVSPAYGMELPIGAAVPAVPVVPAPPIVAPVITPPQARSVPPPLPPTQAVTQVSPLGPTPIGSAPPAPMLVPPVTMDVLPQHGRGGGFSLGRLARRPRPGRGAGPSRPAVPAPGGSFPAGETPRHVNGFPGPAPDAEWSYVSPFPGGQAPAFPGVGSVTGDGALDRPVGHAVDHRATEHRDAYSSDASAARSELASTALSELSMLASYRPELGGGSPSTLARRTPAASSPLPAPIVPEVLPTTARRAPRTADGVRSTVAGFLSGAQRGRGQSGPSTVTAPVRSVQQQPPLAHPSVVPQSAPTDPTPQEHR